MASQALNKGAILPGVGVADGNGGFTTPAPGTQGSTITPPASGAPSGSPATPTVPSTLATPAGGSTAPVNPATPANPDAGYAQAESNITPSAPEGEDAFFDSLYNQLSPVIDSINSTETAAETAAYATGTQEQSDLNESLGDRGLSGGSTAASTLATSRLGVDQNVAQAKQAQSTALSNAYQYLTSQAHTEFTDALAQNTTLSQDYVTAMQNTANATIKGVAEAGITSGSQWQTQDPKGYAAALQYFNGNPEALNSALVMNQPVNNIKQSWTQGSTYYQLVTDPITGQPKIQQLDTGVNIPVGWTSTKVSTNTLLMQDPNNPGNTILYTSDPLGTDVNVTGTGTGTALAAQYNAAQDNNSSSNADSSTSSSSSDGATVASTTVASVLGVQDPTTPLSSVVNGDGTSANPGVGIAALIAAIPSEEGGSPAGVKNNAGNMKIPGGQNLPAGTPIPGIPGATSSGVKGTDGGTFMSFDNASDYEAAVANTVQSALSGTDPNYGPNPTLQSFVDTWTGNTSPPVSSDVSNTTNGSTTPVSSPVNPFTGVNSSTNLSTHEYGALANVPDFNPNNNTDKLAFNYLKTFFGSGTVPAGGRSAALYGATQEVQARAQQLYYAATGQELPNADSLSGQLGNLVSNNTLLNTLQNQTKVIEQNFGLNLENMTENNINNAPPVINKVLDGLAQASGSTSVAQYLSQNTTLSNEIGTLLSLKNASGTTVADKLAAQELNPSDLSLDQQKQILSTIQKEATNQQNSILSANALLYQQTDPAGFNPDNPINAPGFNTAISLGFTDNNDGTFTSEDGTNWTASANGFAPQGDISNPTALATSLGIPLAQVQTDNPNMTPAEIITDYINSQ